jgi:ferrochelatase
MSAGVVLCAFGEPAVPEREAVVAYLERIFHQNAELESPATEDEAKDRARQLAERRAPSLIAEYESIGGSPLNAQATAQAEALAGQLDERGLSVGTYVGLQFTEPFIEDVVERAIADGIEHLVGVPVYPLCGPSTSVAALERLRSAVDEAAGSLRLDEISGWHRHPGYARFRAHNLREYVAAVDVDLHAAETQLVCSAHGTPLRYLEAGSRYRTYVEEHCAALAALLGVDDYTLGYQNHANRDVEWTEPDIETAISQVDADRIVVEPVSFLHEQSETLVELDDDLREDAAANDLAFHRVPVPHDHPRLSELLADLVEPSLAGFEPRSYNFRQCHCRDGPGTRCLNAPLPANE